MASFDATESGVSTAAFSTNPSTNWIRTRKNTKLNNQVTFLLDVVAGTSTYFTFTIDVSNDGSTPYPVQTFSGLGSAADPAVGQDMTYRINLSGNAKVAVNMPANCDYIRLNFSDSGGNGTITVTGSKGDHR